MKRSMDLNTAASMPLTSTEAELRSSMPPKNSALKTGDLAASMALWAAKDSPETRNVTSAPSSLCRRSPRCWCRSEGGGTGRDDSALSVAASKSRSTVTVHSTVSESSTR
uniref:Uncharacterized protein n=1 Tax=Zea mays TaxID=4577 RepID=C4J089_MAIZE|nr:unknown [Zea mays]